MCSLCLYLHNSACWNTYCSRGSADRVAPRLQDVSVDCNACLSCGTSVWPMPRAPLVRGSRAVR